MTATVETHRRIERLAAAMLDVVAHMERDPDVMAGALDMASAQAGAGQLLTDVAGIYAAVHGRATVVGYERGRSLALMQATLTDVAFGRNRKPLDWCEHRTLFDPRQSMIVSALRYAGCAECVQARTRDALGTLEADSTCDVCGADHGLVTERLLPFGYSILSVYTGPCCDELVSYATPAVTTTFRRNDQTRRNDPCPCGSGRKFKQCHGRGWGVA